MILCTAALAFLNSMQSLSLNVCCILRFALLLSLIAFLHLSFQYGSFTFPFARLLVGNAVVGHPSHFFCEPFKSWFLGECCMIFINYMFACICIFGPVCLLQVVSLCLAFFFVGGLIDGDHCGEVVTPPFDIVIYCPVTVDGQGARCDADVEVDCRCHHVPVVCPLPVLRMVRLWSSSISSMMLPLGSLIGKPHSLFLALKSPHINTLLSWNMSWRSSFYYVDCWWDIYICDMHRIALICVDLDDHCLEPLLHHICASNVGNTLFNECCHSSSSYFVSALAFSNITWYVEMWIFFEPWFLDADYLGFDVGFIDVLFKLMAVCSDAIGVPWDDVR